LTGVVAFEEVQLQAGQGQLSGVQIHQVHVSDQAGRREQRSRAASRGNHEDAGAGADALDDFKIKPGVLADLGECQGQGGSVKDPGGQG
jgi:hypothetical protein